MSATATSLDRWYALAVKAGQERSILRKLVERLEKAGQLTSDLEFVCPDEEVVEKPGTAERQVVRRQTLPGYILVRCRNLRPATVGTIMRVTGVMDFLGGAENPTQLRGSEVAAMLKVKTQPGETRAPKIAFEAGQTVTITQGPLTDFSGEIVSVNASAQTVQVVVEIFGRKTPAQVSFLDLRRG
jgi:transcriptional antiterminator NusG